jgi:DNA-binding transcriptional MerR regulator
MRERMAALLARMAETARGFHDEHMNAEAMAELQKEKDMKSGLDAAEEALQRGDVAAAMKALDQMAGQLDQMLAGLQKTGELPDAKQAELMKEMLAFKAQLEQVQAEQGKAAAETEAVKAELRRRMADKLEQGRQQAQRLERLAKEARADLQQAQPGTPPRGEPDLDAAQEALADLQRALAMKDLEAAQEQAQRALAPTRRLATTLEEDAAIAERIPGASSKDPLSLRQAQAQAREAGKKIAEVAKELQKLTPDPRQALTPVEGGKLDQLAKRQQGLERQAGELQQKLSQLMQKAPVFPQATPGLLGEARGHMGQAAGELSQKNAQRGHGEQQAALDAMGRLQQGLEQMAKKGGGKGGGFPFPFGEPGGQGQEGESGDPRQDKVEIPGAEAHRVPEEFRKDLMEAMKQGAPERYRNEVQRYYEELVK